MYLQNEMSPVNSWHSYLFIVSLRIEVADFDFEEEEAPEMSFSERLQSSIFQYWSAMKSRQSDANMIIPYENVTFD